MGTDSNQYDLSLSHPERQHDASRVIDANGMKIPQIPTKLMQPQMRLKGILAKILKHLINSLFQFGILSNELPEVTLERRCRVDGITHSRSPNSSAS